MSITYLETLTEKSDKEKRGVSSGYDRFEGMRQETNNSFRFIYVGVLTIFFYYYLEVCARLTNTESSLISSGLFSSCNLKMHR